MNTPSIYPNPSLQVTLTKEELDIITFALVKMADVWNAALKEKIAPEDKQAREAIQRIRRDEQVLCGRLQDLRKVKFRGEKAFAQLFKAKGAKGWDLFITRDTTLRPEVVIEQQYLPTKTMARQYAESIGATPWNF